MNGVQPYLYKLRPRRYRKSSPPQAIAVPAFGINVQLGRYLGILEREEIHDGVFYVDWIVLCLNDKRRWSLSGGMNAA